MNVRCRINKGTTVNLDGDEFVCQRILQGNRYQFESIENGEIRTLSSEELARVVSLGKTVLCQITIVAED